ncbi:hypothetical protein [Desulfosediminicola ganghwensis]|uniref:hypothetical protein n=1 Tax=Desulfosediminicola ganghwensis TaxID=2569540 RepID=UPI0010AD6F97|nr:hypothetical protein [Desulfosediminicola ganghwensis]
MDENQEVSAPKQDTFTKGRCLAAADAIGEATVTSSTDVAVATGFAIHVESIVFLILFFWR